ncbi:hypothetical protein [Pseudonocardia lacus]|uniref:hypothetical protein n=1 Tax=Pseudonocardia lacus TaxID=2835865 RepID=UPI001BDBB926|nr:hypothetical protein [Pseudonocardia lacus]
MIDPAGIPQIAGDMAALTRHGGDLSQVGTAFADTGARVHTGWQALAGSYSAPEAAQLFAATGPVQGVSASVAEDLRSVGSALISYAGEVTGIQTRLRALQAEAAQFVAFAAANPDRLANQTDVDRHNHLLAAVNAQVAAFQDAERRCANAILALYSDRRYVADNGDGVLQAHEHGVTAAGLAALAQEGRLPWGAAEALDRGFLGDVGDFFAGVGQGVGDVGGRFAGGLGEAAHGAVTGLGMLVGYADGGFSWETAGTAWAGLNALAASLTPVGLVNQFVDLPFMPRGMAQETLLNTVGALSAYDVWGQDPARAAGLVTGNVLLAVLGPKGVGVGLRGGGAAAARSGVPVVARAGEGLVRVGDAIGRLPTITDVVGKVSARLRGLDIPPVALPHADLPPTHIDAPRAEPGAPPRVDGPTVGDDLARDGGASPRAGDLDGSGRHGESDVGRGDGTGAAPEVAGEGIDAPGRSDRGTGGGGPPLPPERIPPPVVRETPLPTRDIEERFQGEDDPTNPNRPFFPDTVQYFDDARREAARVVVVDGRLYEAESGVPLDTRSASNFRDETRAIFVQDSHGNLYVSLEQEVGKVHHSSILGGRSVANAGELEVVNGVPILLNRASGHYRPTQANQQNGIASLVEQGLDLSRARVEGGF